MLTEFRLGASSAADVAAHLRNCDATFVPALSARVDLDEYAAKLTARALCFETWDGVLLVGLVAVYATPGVEQAFVSNVSVLPDARGQRIAQTLMREAIDHVRGIGARRLKLEVGASNLAAVGLYTKLGFRADDEPGPEATMTTLTLGL